MVRCGGGVLLIDCGIGPRTAAHRMKPLGVRVADISAICLTHLDRDHFNLHWIDEICRRGIRVHCHESCVGELLRAVDDPDFARHVWPFDGKPFELQAGVRCQTVRLAHDNTGSHGFALEGFGARLGYATDLGRVERELLDLFCDLDILAIESNYDPQMQRDSARPWFLQQRIMGGRGHLSNAQAFAAVRWVLDRASVKFPQHIVLLHRSRECNCPHVVRDVFARDARIASRLVLAEQDSATPWLAPVHQPVFLGKQLELQWG